MVVNILGLDKLGYHGSDGVVELLDEMLSLNKVALRLSGVLQWALQLG